MTSYAPRQRAIARLMGAAALSVFGLTACETGFIPQEPPILRSVSGIVRVPPTDQDRFASTAPIGLERLFAALFPVAHAEIFGMVPMPNARVQLVILDEAGNIVDDPRNSQIITTGTDGSYGFTEVPAYASTVAVVLYDDQTPPNVVARAFVTGRTVDITPASEALAQAVIDELVDVDAGVTLSNFEAQELAALASLVAGFDMNVTGEEMSFEDAVAAVRTGVEPLLSQVATSFSSPGIVSLLHNGLYGGIDFVPVLKEPTAEASGDGGLELRTEIANWGFNDLNLIAGGQLFGLRTTHDLATAQAPINSPGSELGGAPHIVNELGQVLVGDAAADAVLGAVTGDGGFMVYPRAVVETAGTAVGRGIRIATRKSTAGVVLDNTILDPQGGGTDYHLVRLRQTLSGPLGGVGENAIAVAAETGAVSFDSTDTVASEDNTLAAVQFLVSSSDQLLVELDGSLTRTSAPPVDPVDGRYLVILDGTVNLRRSDASGSFLGQGYANADGSIVSLQTSSNLVQLPLNVLLNDAAAYAGEELTITAVTPESMAGTVTISATGKEVLYTPPPNFTGTEIFSYTVSDGTGSASGTVTFVLDSINQPPVVNDDTFTVAARSVNLLDVSANDIDNDIGQGLIVQTPDTNTQEFEDSGSNVVVVGSGPGNRLRFTPGPSFTGQVSFRYRVRDTFGALSETDALVTVNVIDDGENGPPEAQDDAFSVGIDSENNALDVLANDRDPDVPPATLAITAVESPTARGATVTEDGGILVYTPTGGFSGIDTFSYTISDGIDSDTAQVTVSVVGAGNLPPVANDDSFRVAAASSDNALPVLLNDSDPQIGDTLTITDVDSPTVSGGSVTISGDTLLYTPDAGFTGPDSFTYTLSDAAGASSVATVSVLVGGANAAPEPASDSFGVAVDSTGNVFDVLANDSDPDLDDELTLVDGTFASAQAGTVVVAGGVLTYTPAAEFDGLDSFTYTVTDGTATAEATVSVTVTDANIAPVARDDLWTVAANGSYLLEVLANDSDINGDILGLIGVSLSSDGGDVSLVPDPERPGFFNAILYTPDEDFTGTETFTYTVADGPGGTAGTASARVVVTVLGAAPNTPPQAVNDTSWRVPFGSTGVVLDVLANDIDPDAGDTLAIVAVDGQVPAEEGAAIEIGANCNTVDCSEVTITGGTLNYVPSPELENGESESFTYTIADASGARSTATVTVVVSSTNQPPVVVDDAFHVGLNTTNEFLLLLNDSDPDLGQSLTLSGINGATNAGGSWSVVQGGTSPRTIMQYLPPQNFRGVDTFSYTATDGAGGEAQGTVTVTVSGGNTAPTGSDDAFTVRANGNDIPLDVLANDVDPDYDDALRVVSVTSAANGTVAISQDGTRVLYTPDGGFEGPDGFGYTLSDSRGLTSSAEVDLTVSAAGAPLTVLDDTGWRVVLPANPELWTTNLAQREVGVAIRRGNGLGEGTLSGAYNVVQHAGYLFADGADSSLGAGYNFGTITFDGEGGIADGAVWGRRVALDVGAARVGDPAALLIVPLAPAPEAVSGSYDVATDGAVALSLAIGADTVITGNGAVSADGEVVAVAVRVEEGGDDSGRGLLFLVRQPQQ